MKRALLALLVLIPLMGAPSWAADDKPCGDFLGAHCGLDAAQGQFHGLIMVAGEPSVLETAAHSGTKPGCGDCTWTLVVACIHGSPAHAADQDACGGSTGSSACHKGEVAFRVYLSTEAELNRYVGSICLGGPENKAVVPVGDIAVADVQRFLKDITPPLLSLRLAPPSGTPTGLPTYFWVRPPDDLRPVPFGSGTVTETITISPQRYRWDWGDGQSSGWTADAGAPYPDGTLTHTYAHPGRYAGTVTAEWGGTYTISVAGQTFGPYDAVGTVRRTQPFHTEVLRARPVLVSHG